MRTKTEVTEALNYAKKRLREVKKQFEKYDNHDDLEELGKLRTEVATLQWVLHIVAVVG